MDIRELSRFFKASSTYNKQCISSSDATWKYPRILTSFHLYQFFYSNRVYIIFTQINSFLQLFKCILVARRMTYLFKKNMIIISTSSSENIFHAMYQYPTSFFPSFFRYKLFIRLSNNIFSNIRYILSRFPKEQVLILQSGFLEEVVLGIVPREYSQRVVICLNQYWSI